MMECVLSIIDEGTRLHALVASIGGGRVGSASIDGPTNPRYVETHGLTRRLEKVIGESSLGLNDASCLAVAASVPADPETLRSIIAELVPIDREQILITTVERAALVGSLRTPQPRDAIVVRSDVCSRAWGVDSTGEESVCGGFGHVLGDEGSAYWIGAQGIRASLRALERRSKNTVMKSLLLSRFGVDSYRELLTPEFLPDRLDRYAIADFSTAVFEAAGQDDEVALAFLDEAGRELATMVLGVVNDLNLLDVPFSVLPIGSVFDGKGTCLETFIKVLKSKTRKASLVEPGLGAIAGGVLLAIQHLGLKPRPETAETLMASLKASS